MASSGPHGALDDSLRKIHEGLQTEKKWQSAEASNNVDSGVKTFQILLDDYESVLEESIETLLYLDEKVKISTCYPFHDVIEKSKILEDSKLFEAILCSRIFENAAQYDSSHHLYKDEELVWVRDNSNEYDLIYGGRIIYALGCQELDRIREYTQKIWESLKNNVLRNLEVAFGVESAQEVQSKSNQSSQGAVHTPVADAVRTLILDELNSINPDPLLRRLFESDFKALADKDIYFWRDRLELLRSCCGSATSSELTPLIRAVSDLEKIEHESYLASIVDTKPIVDFPGSVAKFERLVKDNEKKLGIMNDSLTKLAELAEAARKAENEKSVEMVPTGKIKKENETRVVIHTRLKDTRTPLNANTSQDSVGQEASQELKKETQPSDATDEKLIENSKLNEQKLQKLVAATSFLEEIVKIVFPFSIPTDLEPSRNLVEKMYTCEQNLFSDCSSDPETKMPESLRTLRIGVPIVASSIQCQKFILDFLTRQMSDLYFNLSNRDFKIKQIVLYQLTSILKENFGSSLEVFKDCVGHLKERLEAWNVDPNSLFGVSNSI